MAAIHDYHYNPRRSTAGRIRGNTIRLHRRLQKFVFFGGLAGVVVLIALPLFFPFH